MNTPVIILIAAAVGLVTNTIAVLGIAWKGGIVLGQMQQSLLSVSGDMGGISEEMGKLGILQMETARTLERTSTRLDGLEGRVERIEQRVDRGPTI